MLRKTLQQTHDSWDGELWADYEALYSGGKKFFDRIGNFLQRNPQEPLDVYRHRLREAHYRCYLGGIVDFFKSYLFSSSLTVRAKNEAGDAVDPDQFYSDFKEDCDGRDNDVHVFLEGRVREAMVKRCSWWLVEKPQAPDGVTIDSKADWKKHGLDKLHLRDVDATDVLDWEIDDDGQLVWAIVCSVKVVRPLPTDTRTNVVERYDVYDRTNVQRFELVYDKRKKPPKDVDVPAKGPARAHGFDCVPLVCLDLGDGLWVANRAGSPQIEHLRLANALGWSIRRTCYAMPVLNLEDSEKPPAMGAGYWVTLGLNEKFNWSAPDTGPIAEIRAEVKDVKDEIFRIVHQMANGVDNNAASVGRSGQSKEADAEAVRIILGAMGKTVREAVERTYALLSDGRDEGYAWSIEGLNSFENIDIDKLVAAAQGIQLLDIRSPTFQREMQKRTALAAVADADQDVKDAITSEIEENVTDESVLNPEPDVPDDPEDIQDEANDAKQGGVKLKTQPKTAATKPAPKAKAKKPKAKKGA